jgi:hypothetical protein
MERRTVAIALEESGNSEPLRMIASEPGMDAVNLLEPSMNWTGTAASPAATWTTPS